MHFCSGKMLGSPRGRYALGFYMCVKCKTDCILPMEKKKCLLPEPEVIQNSLLVHPEYPESVSTVVNIFFSFKLELRL
jgi:hypothetical protein